MRLRLTRQTAARRDRGAHRPVRLRPVLLGPNPGASERRLRDSGGTLDTAFYACSCGCGFQAAVSTSVACPDCGTGQAW